MRFSTKARYGLISLIYMTQQYGCGEHVTLLQVAEKLGVSKVYMEQIFALLRKAELVAGVRGLGGGYKLTRPPHEINAYEVLSAADTLMFEKTRLSLSGEFQPIESAMEHSVFDVIDEAVKKVLVPITLDALAHEAEKNRQAESPMFFI